MKKIVDMAAARIKQQQKKIKELLELIKKLK